MLDCPRCHQPIESQAIRCPHCRMQLKAHGHPGIPLYRASAGEFLCQTCVYDADDTCNFPQRPQAKECTLYLHPDQTQLQQTPEATRRSYASQHGWRQKAVWLVLLGLIGISILIAL